MPDDITALSAVGTDVWSVVAGAVIESTDSGAHWRRLGTIAGGSRSLSFTSAAEGWAATAAGLLHTTDGGATWQPSARTDAVRRVGFADRAHGWVLTANGVLARTTDGGASWRDVHNPCTPGPGGEFAEIALPSFFGASDGWMLCPGEPGTGQQGKDLYRTRDGGSTWALIASSSDRSNATGHFQLSGFGYANDLMFVDARLGWIALSRANVLTTDDGAQSWHSLSLPAAWGEPFVYGIVFTDARHGFLVEGDVLAATEDGGATWTQVYTLAPEEPPASAAPPQPGANLRLGGISTTWSALLPGFHVLSAVTSDDLAWVVATPCRDEQLPPGDAAQAEIDSKYVCDAPELLHTDDAGRSWEHADLDGLDVSQVWQAGDAIRVALGGVTFETTDDGKTFVRVRAPLFSG
jgi:photosystem II stability/assembly factor-like uncharacterized protein